MVTSLRSWSRQYPWLHNTISPSTLKDVEREIVLCNLTIENILMKSDTGTLDLCYSEGKSTNLLSTKTTGFNVSSTLLFQAFKGVFEVNYVYK
ncbi:MAG: hypothetical protein ACQZ3M_05160 [cyanobacterium endosymbiont of Rhopalodia fuxianensis]